MEIAFQNYFWFTTSLKDNGEHGNIYNGSVGTDPQGGCLQCENMSYKAYVAKDEDGQFVFFAESWFTLPWVAGKGKKVVDFEQRRFPNEEESVERIKQWLAQRAERLEK